MAVDRQAGPAFGKVLREARLRADLTQKMLAERASLSTRTIQHLEAGRGLPYADTAGRLAVALDLVGLERETFEQTARLARARMRHPRSAQGAPPTSLDAATPWPGNLRQPFTSFIGREEEIRRVLTTFETTNLVTLVGVGGVGKTRLAIEVAQRASNLYADGAVFVELGGLSEPGLVPYQVATALRISEVPGAAMADTLVEGLRARRLLLVIDNCEHLLDACAALTRLLVQGCPELRVLLTSRVLLGVEGETVLRVPSLSLPVPGTTGNVETSEAAKLFVARARSTAPRFAITPENEKAIASVCIQLEGIPLALELAAARVRSLGVSELATRLHACFSLLTGGEAERPARQQTLRAAVDWSYALLSESERAFFARLSVFNGGSSLEAIEAVCGIESTSTQSVVDVLAQLVDKSLLTVEPLPDGSVRYRLLEPLRQYAADRLAEMGAAEVARTRHADHYCAALARRWQPVWWGPELAERLGWVERELENLRTALNWLLSIDGLDLVLRVLYALGPFWLVSSRVGEGYRRTAAAVAKLPLEAEPNAARAGAVVWCGGLAVQDGQHAVGQNMLQRGLDMARRCDDALAQAYALMWLAITAGLAQQTQLACSYAAQGLAVSRERGYGALEGMCLRVLAQAAFEAGDLDEAWRLSEEGLRAGRQAHHPPSIAWALETLGFIRFKQGLYSAARTFFEESLAQGRGMLAAPIRQNTIVCLALVALEEGDLVEAFEHARDALEMPLSVPGGRASQALPLEALAQIAVAARQPAAALRLAGAASARRRLALTPSQHAQLERWLHRARALLDSPGADAAWLVGQLMSTEAVLTEVRALQASIIPPKRAT
ncbi:MAG: helix-turn-helix domain-containing protein [Chloroflexi bacterium]|nr:helix-turn-helix domain-containing protein [Chloroflexota bacterium]